MSDRIFASQKEVLAFLNGLGLKIARSKLSSDFRAGKLVSQPDKTFLESDVLAYAETLKNPGSDKFAMLSDEVKSLHRVLRHLLEAVPDLAALKRVLQRDFEAHPPLEPLAKDALARIATIREAEANLRREAGENQLKTQRELARAYAEIERLTKQLAKRTRSPASAGPFLPEPFPDTSGLEPLVFVVMGTKSPAYEVTFTGAGESLQMECTCPSYRFRRYFCKHAARLLVGDGSGLLEGCELLAALQDRATASPLLEMARRHPSLHRQACP